MRPRKKIFAANYLRETIDSFDNIWDKKAYKSMDNPQHKWFKDVIGKYFEVVSDTPLIREQRKRFAGIVNGYISDFEGKRSIPYRREVNDGVNIDFEEFYRLTTQRRSVRWYLPKPVPREVIDKAILAARQSPSACNRQPFEFKIFDNADLVKELVEFPMGTKGYSHSIPVFAVIVGTLDAYAAERDRHLIYIDGALAAMTFMLALETLGLSTCPINWPDIDDREKKMSSFLGLSIWQRPIMCLGLGYPDPEGEIAFSEKRNIAQIRNFNIR